jgi:hypothetical protein
MTACAQETFLKTIVSQISKRDPTQKDLLRCCTFCNFLLYLITLVSHVRKFRSKTFLRTA